MDARASREGNVVTLAHGAGGSVMQSLIKSMLVKRFCKLRGRGRVEIGLADLDDSGVVDGMAFTTDSHTVKPLFFPGGDIGSLSIAGTVNDLSVMGAEPLALSSALVMEEGFPVADLERIADSMHSASKRAGVPIITGDTKVVERGALDKLIINTSGIGRQGRYLKSNAKEVRRYRKFGGPWLRDSNLRHGDTVIVTGFIGDHGIAVLSSREGYGFESVVKSDVAPLNRMLESALREGGIVACKDPTRGGLANTLNEWSEKSGVGIIVEEDRIPLRESVRSACEMLGIDPLAIGNEGKAVIGVVKEKADAVLQVLKRTREGRHAAIIGKADRKIKGVVLNTSVGGRRILEQPAGDPVPRIC
jgi:hydrogenase expression/formation protein HypE